MSLDQKEFDILHEQASMPASQFGGGAPHRVVAAERSYRSGGVDASVKAVGLQRAHRTFDSRLPQQPAGYSRSCSRDGDSGIGRPCRRLASPIQACGRQRRLAAAFPLSLLPWLWLRWLQLQERHQKQGERRRRQRVFGRSLACSFVRSFARQQQWRQRRPSAEAEASKKLQ